MIASLCAAGIIAVMLASASAAAPSALHLAIAGTAQPVFVWQTMHCAPWDVPDTSARAWRDAEGRVHLLASSDTNREMVGSALDHLRQDCHVVFKGDEKDAPQAYDDHGWLAATYTNDGRTVFALIHNEFHGQLRPALCPSRDYLQCWSNAVTLAVSHDEGTNFALAAPQHLVAALPERYRGDRGHRSGYFNPSNIFMRDGFYYAFFWAEADGAQQRGACLMRTANLQDPSAWRTWDGTSFSRRFIDPYTDTAASPAEHVCVPVGVGSLVSFVSSVTRDRTTDLYVAMMATAYAEKANAPAIPGIYWSSSGDLIHWTVPSLLKQEPLLFKYACSDQDAFAYPSLLDTNAPGRNFEETGDHAYLFVTEIHLANCHVGTDRDLVRFPITITAQN